MLYERSSPLLDEIEADYEQHEPTVEVPYSYSSYQQPITKCSRDNRDFKVLVLENQLEVMLISDSEAKNGCVALNLLVGSGMDLPNLHGLANLTLKWMLRSSKRYSTDGQFHSFVREHGGAMYSHVTLKTTEISVGLDVNKLHEILERLADLLGQPCFERQVAEKVIHGIDSDHKRFLKQENMSIKLLERNFFKPREHMTHFKTGNRETLLVNPPKLGLDIHQEAQRFYDTYYSSNLMKLVVLGNQGLPTLTNWVVSIFSGLTNKIIPVPQIERIFLPPDFNRQILVKSHQHTRSLVLLFPLFGAHAGHSTASMSDFGEPLASGEDSKTSSTTMDASKYSLNDEPSSPTTTTGKKSENGPGGLSRSQSRRSSVSTSSLRSNLSGPASTTRTVHGMSGYGGYPPHPGMMPPTNPYNMTAMAQALPGAPMPMGMPYMYPPSYLPNGGMMPDMVQPQQHMQAYPYYPPQAMAHPYMSPAAFYPYMMPPPKGLHSHATAMYGPYGRYPLSNMVPPMSPASISNPAGVDVPVASSGYHPSNPKLDMERDWAPALAYVRHLLELRTPGSVIHYLKSRGWGTYIHTADVMDLDCDTPFFKMTVSLTKAGFDAYEEVIKAILQYLAMIRRTGVQHWLYDEIRSTAAIKFFMRAKYNDFDCPRFADIMGREGLEPRDYVCDQAMYYQCQEDTILQALSCLSSNNMAILVVSRDIESPGMSREIYYETKYQITSLPLTLQMALADLKKNDQFYLPTRNPYVIERLDASVPSTMALQHQELPLSKAVAVIAETMHTRCWHYYSNKFFPPRTNIHIALQSPLAYKTAASMVRTRVMVKLFQERCRKMIDSTSAAGAAAMFHTVEPGRDGIQITLEGFNEKQELMLTHVLTALNDIKVDPYRLKFFIDEYILDLQCEASVVNDSPTAFVETHLTSYNWPHDALVSELKTITVSDMTQFVQNYLNRIHIEMLVAGNATESEALDFMRITERNIKRTSMLKVERYATHALHLPLGGRLVYLCPTHKKPTNAVNDSSAATSTSNGPLSSKIAYFVQVGASSDARLRVYQDVVAHIIQDKCLTTFKHQLNLSDLNCQPICRPNLPLGLLYTASGAKDALYLESGMELCLQTARRALLDLSPVLLEEYLQQLRETRLTQAKAATSTQVWQGVIYDCPAVYQTEELDILASINKSSLCEFFKRYYDKHSRFLTKLSVHSTPSDKMPMMDGQLFIKDVETLKPLLGSEKALPRPAA
ncbi:metalloprotease [Dimargaris xerosporica]|nr:metalloprotease [Dimargaris xerosporica]